MLAVAFTAPLTLVDWLSPPGGKYKGACRTGVQGVSAGQGVFQELWGKSENECREACEIQAVCQAYEHATMPNNYKRCEKRGRGRGARSPRGLSQPPPR